MKYILLVAWASLLSLVATAQTTALSPEKQGGDVNKIFDIRKENPNIKYDFIKFNPKYQPAPLSRKCMAVEVDKEQKAIHAGERVIDFESWLQRSIEENKGMTRKAIELYTIPVVIHVIYSNEDENIPKEQILSQIEALNRDYQRKNADTTQTPKLFKPLAANVGLQFKLATRTPDGKPTDGIERISVSGSPFREKYFNEVIKPNTIWDPYKYLNIWVANLANGVLGFAQFPASSGLVGIPNQVGTDQTDGVVINYLAFGTVGNLMDPFNYGRTATHEVGHWLGLRHIWGDGACDVDDFCDDTPDSDAPHFGCNTKVKACDGKDAMIQNFMDYTNDECMNLFTQKQRERVHSVMENSPRRKELHDAGTAKPLELNPKADFITDLPMGAAGLAVQFKDISQGSIGTRTWKFEGGEPATSTISAPKVTFPKAGKYRVSLTVKNSKGVDSLVQEGAIQVWERGLKIPAKWDFETGNNVGNVFFPQATATNVWKINRKAGGFALTSNNLYIDNYKNKKIGEHNVFILPPIDFTTGYKNLLSFDLAYLPFSEHYMDSLGIYLSTDNGKTFRCIYFKYGNDLTTFEADTANFLPSVSHWRTELIDLQKYDNQTSVMLAFVNFNGYGNNLFLDNIEVNALPMPVPQADFQLVKKEVCVGEKIEIADKSKYQPEKWIWSFPGADIPADSIANPTISYNSPGTYDILLTVSNKNGSTSKEEKGTIVVKPSPSLTLSALPTSVCWGESLRLTAESEGLVTWKVFKDDFTKIRKTLHSNICQDTLKANTRYQIEAKGENKCAAFKEYTVSVKENTPIEIIPPAANICVGDSVTLTAKNATKYEWFPSMGLNQNTGNSVVAKPQNTITYTLEAMAANGCLQRKEVIVNVQTLPNVKISTPKTVACLGEQLRLVAEGAANYFWKIDGANMRTNGRYLTISPNKNTLYEVVGISEAGCSAAAELPISVAQPPVISYQPMNPTVCEGGAISLTAEGAQTYSWQANETEIFDKIFTLEPRKEVICTLTGISEEGCISKLKIPIKVYPQKEIKLESDATVVCPNRMVVITASGANTYNWNGTDGYTSTSASISVAPNKVTTYQVSGTDEHGCATDTQSIEIGIGSKELPTADFMVEETDVCTKTPVKFIDNSENVKKYFWEFQKENEVIRSNLASPEIIFPKAGIYHVKLKVEGCLGGAEVEKDIAMNVQESPDVILSTEKNVICEGETILLSSAAKGNSTFSWFPSEGLSKTQGKSVLASPKQTTEYAVTAINENGCKSTSKTKIQVKQSLERLKFNIVSPTVCQGESILLAVLNGRNPEWKYETELYRQEEVRFSPKKTTTYKVSALDSTGCVMKEELTIKVNERPKVTVNQKEWSLCKGGQVKLTADGAKSYHWSPDVGLSGISGQTITAFPSKSNTYMVVGTDDNDCKDSAYTQVKVMETAAVAISPSALRVCEGETLTLMASGVANLVWTDGDGRNLGTSAILALQPEKTNQYFVIAKSKDGCNSSANVIVEVLNPEPIIVSPQAVTLCFGDTVTLKAQGKGKFIWDENVSENQRNKANVWVQPQATTLYTVKSTDEKGCVHTGLATVTVRKAENVRVMASAFEACEGQDITLEVEGGKTYQWLPADNFPQTTAPKITVSPKRGMTYKVVSKDDYGCKDTANVNIMMRTMKPEFSASATEIDLATAKGVVRFSDKTPEATSWKWDFGDGSKGDGKEMLHIFTQVGEYPVKLEISNGSCSQILTKTIKVKNSSSIQALSNWEVKTLPNNQFEIMMTVPQVMTLNLNVLNVQKESVLGGVLHLSKGNFSQTIDLNSLEKGKYGIEISDEKEQLLKEVEVK
ncbi:MAG: PKD domain-containing protein [Bacteroidia bacterium]